MGAPDAAVTIPVLMERKIRLIHDVVRINNDLRPKVAAGLPNWERGNASRRLRRASRRQGCPLGQVASGATGLGARVLTIQGFEGPTS